MYLKKIIVTLVVFFIVSDLSAQTALSLGPRLGINFSKFWGDESNLFENKTGYTGGLFLSVVPGGKGVFAIAPELLFQQGGASIKNGGNTGINNLPKIKVNYLTVPVPLKFRIPIAGTFYPNVFVGPEFAILVYDNQITDLRRGDIGGIFGAGLDIERKRLFFNIELRYKMGALSINKGDMNLEDIKNAQFTILTGIGVRLGK